MSMSMSMSMAQEARSRSRIEVRPVAKRKSKGSPPPAPIVIAVAKSAPKPQSQLRVQTDSASIDSDLDDARYERRAERNAGHEDDAGGLTSGQVLQFQRAMGDAAGGGGPQGGGAFDLRGALDGVDFDGPLGFGTGDGRVKEDKPETVFLKVSAESQRHLGSLIAPAGYVAAGDVKSSFTRKVERRERERMRRLELSKRLSGADASRSALGRIANDAEIKLIAAESAVNRADLRRIRGLKRSRPGSGDGEDAGSSSDSGLDSESDSEVDAGMEAGLDASDMGRGLEGLFPASVADSESAGTRSHGNTGSIGAKEKRKRRRTQKKKTKKSRSVSRPPPPFCFGCIAKMWDRTNSLRDWDLYDRLVEQYAFGSRPAILRCIQDLYERVFRPYIYFREGSEENRALAKYGHGYTMWTLDEIKRHLEEHELHANTQRRINYDSLTYMFNAVHTSGFISRTPSGPKVDVNVATLLTKIISMREAVVKEMVGNVQFKKTHEAKTKSSRGHRRT